MAVAVRPIGSECAEPRTWHRSRAVQIAAHRDTAPAHLFHGVQIGRCPGGARARARARNLVLLERHHVSEVRDVALIQEWRYDPTQPSDPLNLVGPLAGFVCDLVDIIGPIVSWVVRSELHVVSKGEFAEPGMRGDNRIVVML